METIAVVVARKGSERFPGKHLEMLGGQALVVYSIKAALRAKTVSRVYISTDDEEIGKVGSGAGAIFMRRPAELCAANVSALDAWRWTVEETVRDGYPAPEVVVGMYGNVPFDRGCWIDQGVRLLELYPEAGGVSQLGPVGHFHPNDAVVVADGKVVPYVEYKSGGALKSELTDSQRFTPAYMGTGLALVRRWPFEKYAPMLPAIRDRMYFDVHTPEELALAERMLGREQEERTGWVDPNF